MTISVWLLVAQNDRQLTEHSCFLLSASQSDFLCGVSFMHAG
jgi:hypothetical protein